MLRILSASISLLLLVLQAEHVNAAAAACGDGTRDGTVTASDALLTLRTSVGSDGCDSCLCDTNGDGALAASDALCVLKVATGSPCPLTCSECGTSICGDGEVPPITGDLLGDDVHIDNCLLLDVESYEDDIDVVLLKALDSDLAPVEGATASVDNLGCDCFSLVARSKPEPRGSTLVTTTTSTTSSTAYEACNCYVSVDVSSPKPLAVVEVFVEPWDGQCDGTGGGLPIARLDAGVEEECDDGNAIPGDGCSQRCFLEPDGPCATNGDCAEDRYCDFHRGTGLCEIGCRDDESCPDDHLCALASHTCTPTP